MKKLFSLFLTACLSVMTALGANVTIYYDIDSSDWEEVWFFTWNTGNDANAAWPGVKLENKDKTTYNGKNVYKISVPSQNKVIFGNGEAGVEEGNQTENLPVVADYVYTNVTTADCIKYADVKPTGSLPVLYIHCPLTVIASKDLADKDYRKATYWLDAKGINGWKNVGSADDMLPLEIKARGNYTRTGFAKKPFKLKLDKKQDLLGLTPEKSKHYAILAHADDGAGYLKNFVGFKLGRMLSEQLPFTPGMQPIEVVINGDYRGIYFLTESIRVGDGRIDIKELKDNETDSTKISGGYVIEFDNYADEAVMQFDDPRGRDLLRITPDTPEKYSDIQWQFVHDQFEVMNDLVHEQSDSLWKYLDLDAAAAYYIVEEIIDHRESYHGSTYLFRDYGHGKKWMFSPLWDCGNAFTRESPGDSFTDHPSFGNNWINDLLDNEKFKQKVREIWKWFWGTQVDNLYTDIESYVKSIKEAAARDHKRWGSADLPVSDNRTPVQNNTDMDGKWRSVKNMLDVKIAWLKEEWGAPDPNAKVPAHDTTPAAELPLYAWPADEPEDPEQPGDDNQNPNPENPGEGDETDPGTQEPGPGEGDDPGNGDDQGDKPGSGDNQGDEPGSGDTPGNSDGIVSATIDTEETAEYFDLFGRRVEHPAAGNIYILRTGSGSKLIVK